jgi:hypothetical protein
MRRQTQHRTEREQAKGKELAAAKREVKQLKRLVARLQKTVQKLQDGRDISGDIEVSPTPEVSPEPRGRAKGVSTARTDEGGCPQCGSGDLTSLTVPGGTTVLTVCKNCGLKTRTKK